MDEMDQAPAAGDPGDIFPLFPALDTAPLPLADVFGISLQPVDNCWKLTDGEVDNTVRPVHVPTSTIQELLCGPLCRCVVDSSASEPRETTASRSAADAPVSGPDAGGPRIDPNSVRIRGEKIRFDFQGAPLLKASVDPRGILVTSFDTRDGWIPSTVRAVNYNTNRKRLTVDLQDAPGGNLIRLIVRGTGEFPFLGRNRIPLAGALGGPPGGEFDGNDFVYMFRVRS
jgi:hypothetical protein